MQRDEKEALLSSLGEARETGQITVATRNLLSETFGARFRNATVVIDAGKVHKLTFHPSNRTVWLVIGKEKQYLILANAGFCSCEDFYFRVISHEESLCYHLLAQRLAEALGQFSATEEKDDQYEEIIRPSVTELEHSRKLSIRDTETIRQFVAGLLAEAELPLESIVGALAEAGFPSLERRHLATILAADKTRRFNSKKGLWSLTSRKVA